MSTRHALPATIGISFVVCFLGFHGSGNASPMNNQTLLMRDLFTTGYDPRTLPFTSVTELPIIVNCTFSLYHIVRVDAKDQMMSISGYFTLTWYDSRLTWEPEKYGGLQQIFVPAKNVWVPDFGQGNSYIAEYDYSKAKDFIVMVDHRGIILWYIGKIFHAGFALDPTHFPFDTQVCTYHFAVWMHPPDTLLCKVGSHEIPRVKLPAAGQWDVRAMTIYDRVDSVNQYNNKSGSWSSIQLDLVIARNPLFYSVNILIPTAVISLLAMTVFLLPCESGEKVSLGITVLLAYTVFQIVIADTLPRNTNSIPLIVIYLTTLMCTTGLSIVMTVAVLNIHHRGGRRIPPPKWIRACLLGPLAKITCYRWRLIQRNSKKEEKNTTTFDRRKSEMVFLSSVTDSCEEDNRPTLDGAARSGSDVGSRGVSDDEIQWIWADAANVMDRFLLILYIIANIIISSIFLTKCLHQYYSIEDKYS